MTTTTIKVKKGIAYFEGESFTLSNTNKVKTLDFSEYKVQKNYMIFSRSGNDLKISVTYSNTVTIKDYFNSKGSAASTVKTIRIFDSSEKKKYKDYNLTTSGILNHIESGVDNFAVKKGVITGTPFADTISASDFNKPTGRKKDTGVTIKTGLGNDTVTGSAYKDTFNITGSGNKTIYINANDGDDTIRGINTKNTSLNLNISNSVSKYQRAGNDLKITATSSNSSTTTTIKDYFKTSTAPDVNLNDYSLLNRLNDTELVLIDKHTQRKKQNIKGTFLNDIITGSKKADKITTGKGTDTIIGGKGNDKVTIDGNGSKYIVMNTGDGVDTVNTKVNDYIYLQFTGAGITGSDTAKNNLTYEKSGKNDIKITSTVESAAIISPTGYISNTGIGTNNVSYYYSSAYGSYYTHITEDTGLYSYEANGETKYTTEKNATVKLDTAKLIQSKNSYTGIVDSVGYLTTSNDYSESTNNYTVTSLSDESVTTLYAYKSKTYTGIYEYVYSTSNNVAIKYSDLWLKKPYSDSNYYVFTTTKENDDCIQVSSLDKIYHWYDTVKLERTSDTYEEITKDKFDSTYYIDKNHQYVIDIDNNNNTPIYKTFDISNSYYLELPDPHYSLDKGMAITSALTENSYTKIENIYKTTDDDGKIVYTIERPENFKEKSDSTSVIIKDYLKTNKRILITNSNSTSSATWLDEILNSVGLNIGNANSKKAQKLTGSRLNDNIFGGSGKDKITTGTSSSYDRGDIINPGKGNDTITIDGDGKKTINIANNDGNDKIIFTDNNKKTKYDYSTSKMLNLNFGSGAELTYSMNGKDLVINRSYTANGKQSSAKTTLKDYFKVDYKEALANNIKINGTTFNPSDYFDNTTINKSAGKKSQKINGNMFNNTIIGGSGNDTINGCGGSDTMDGGKGSDTYVVNYNSGSKHSLASKITISDTGDGAKDVDTLKLDVKKKDMALLFNISKITDSSDYTDNDIIVGSGDSAIHYSMDNQLMIFADIEQMDEGVRNNSGKYTSAYGIIADGLEKITTSDKKTVTLNNIKSIAQDVANWLSSANGGSGYDNAADVFESGNVSDFIAMLAKYNPDNTTIKEYMNAG